MQPGCHDLFRATIGEIGKETPHPQLGFIARLGLRVPTNAAQTALHTRDAMTYRGGETDVENQKIHYPFRSNTLLVHLSIHLKSAYRLQHGDPLMDIGRYFLRW